MTSPLDRLNTLIRDLEAALEAEVAENRKKFRYRLDRRRAVFEADILARHRAARERLSSFLARTRFLVVLTAPVIYLLILPLVVLDLFVSLYQAVCFPVYGIPKVRRRDYIVFDRQQLGYLNGLQKLNCVYCSYANGLIAQVREVAARTEAFWCPIKHAQRIPDPHLRYHGFADFGDETAFQDHVEAHRRALREGRQVR
jgi:hypothetical protein